jgi:hypothetical protein
MMQMPDPSLTPAIVAALRYNELGNASPYVLSFARLGQSGASFGIFQADTNTNVTAQTCLSQAMQAYGVSDGEIAEIMADVSQPMPNGPAPLLSTCLAVANAALSSTTGMALVDAMDGNTLSVVLGEVDQCIAAAGSNTISPGGLCAIACWVNMTGEPNVLKTWLSGTSVLGLEPPAGPTVLQADVMTYLAATLYFRLHPRNLGHLQDAVAAGVAALPAAPDSETADDLNADELGKLIG